MTSHTAPVRRRITLAASVLLVAILGSILIGTLGPQEPVYQGRKLSEWMTPLTDEQQGVSAGSAEWEIAEKAIHQAGTNAIPTLLRLLRTKDSTTKVRLVEFARRQSLVRIAFTPAAKWNAVAQRAFKSLGSEARGAVPELVQIAEQDISPASHYASIDALGNIGPEAREAVPALLGYATNGDPSLRWHAINALSAIGAEPGRVVPVFISALDDPNSRPSAAYALGKFGTNATSAAAALVKFLHSREDITDKSIFTDALKQIGAEAAAEAGVK